MNANELEILKISKIVLTLIGELEMKQVELSLERQDDGTLVVTIFIYIKRTPLRYSYFPFYSSNPMSYIKGREKELYKELRKQVPMDKWPQFDEIIGENQVPITARDGVESKLKA